MSFKYIALTITYGVTYDRTITRPARVRFSPIPAPTQSRLGSDMDFPPKSI